MNKALGKLAEKHAIKMIVLFGSVAKNRANENSDVDLAVSFYKKPTLRKELELRHQLSNLFGREVDLIFFDKAGALLLGQIAKEGKLLFGEKEYFNSTRINSMKIYLDFEPYFQLQEKINKHKLKHA